MPCKPPHPRKVSPACHTPIRHTLPQCPIHAYPPIARRSMTCMSHRLAHRHMHLASMTSDKHSNMGKQWQAMANKRQWRTGSLRSGSEPRAALVLANTPVERTRTPHSKAVCMCVRNVRACQVQRVERPTCIELGAYTRHWARKSMPPVVRPGWWPTPSHTHTATSTH